MALYENHETHVSLPVKEMLGRDHKGDMQSMQLPGFVRLTDLPATDHLPERTVMVAQRYLLTMIETTLDRGEAMALVDALCSHFRFTEAELKTGFLSHE